MKIEDHIPSKLLSSFIKIYKIIESTDEVTNNVLPGTSLALAFRYKGQNSYHNGDDQLHLPASVLSGLRTTVRLISYAKNTATLVILFREGGAAAFFREPLYELYEQSIALDNFVCPQEIRLIEEQLSAALNNTQRVAVVEQFLLQRLRYYSIDNLVFNAVEIIKAAKGGIRIKDLSATLYLSHDAFEKRFRKVVGTSPKQFSTIVRMISVVHQKGQMQSLAGRALDAGYYDQPHFNKQFKLFTGHTPTDFFRLSSFW